MVEGAWVREAKMNWEAVSIKDLGRSWWWRACLYILYRCTLYLAQALRAGVDIVQLLHIIFPHDSVFGAVCE